MQTLGRNGWLLALALLSSCMGHGRHTSELLEESTENQARLGAATKFDLASQQFRGGRLEQALATIDGSIELFDEVAAAHVLRSRILLELDRPDAALVAIARALALEPGGGDLHYHRMMVLESLGRTDEALLEVGQLEEVEGVSVRSLLAAAELLVDLDRFEEARTRLDTAPLILQQSPGIRQARAHLEWMDGRIEAAAQLFTEAVLMAPSDPELREDLFQVLVAQGRFAEAETTAEWLTHQEGYADRRDLQLMHASCLLELDRPLQARGILLHLAEGAGANDYDVWSRLVDVAALMEDDTLLDRASSRLLRLDRQRAQGYLARAWYLRGEGRDADALQVLEGRPAELAGDPTLTALQTRLASEVQDPDR